MIAQLRHQMQTATVRPDTPRLRVIAIYWPADAELPTITVKRGLIGSRSAAKWIERQPECPDTLYDIEVDRAGDEI